MVPTAAVHIGRNNGWDKTFDRIGDPLQDGTLQALEVVGARCLGTCLDLNSAHQSSMHGCHGSLCTYTDTNPIHHVSVESFLPQTLV